MTKGLLRSHKDFNHEIWKCSFVALTQKVLHFLDHKLHIFPALGRINHIGSGWPKAKENPECLHLFYTVNHSYSSILEPQNLYSDLHTSNGRKTHTCIWVTFARTSIKSAKKWSSRINLWRAITHSILKIETRSFLQKWRGRPAE